MFYVNYYFKPNSTSDRGGSEFSDPSVLCVKITYNLYIILRSEARRVATLQ